MCCFLKLAIKKKYVNWRKIYNSRRTTYVMVYMHCQILDQLCPRHFNLCWIFNTLTHSLQQDSKIY
jgi:hypothetical protein